MKIPQTSESPHLTVPQLAERWQTTPQAIYMARHRRKAPKGFRRGREVLFPLAEVEAFEAAAVDADPKSGTAMDPTLRPPEPARPRRRRLART
ncbi:DNA-binding protein [Streptomyces sp. NPDC019937]|uniref:DNA-binding protein n=1 Tax=Streptomyces sp. NPDC019937 TaxID=3154787 RepID=UPI0033DA43EC